MIDDQQGIFPAVMDLNELNGKNGFAVQTMPQYRLGGGHSSDRQMPAKVVCLAPMQTKYDGNAVSRILFSNSMEFTELEKSLNIKISESATIDLFSQDFSAEYARHVKETDYSMSFYYIETIKLPSAFVDPIGYGEKALNDLGKGVYQDGPEQFRKVCGDQYMAQREVGAGLYATITVHFNSVSDKMNFKANEGVKYGSIMSISASIEKFVNKNHLKGGIEISALQIGGDVSQIAKIFNAGPNPYAVTSCSLEHMVECRNAINGIVAYAADNFPNQINYQDGTIIGNAAALNYIPADFSDLGLEVGNSIITPAIEVARKKLGDLYLHNQKEQIFIKHILESSIFSFFRNDYKYLIQQTSDNLKGNINLLENTASGAMACYNYPENCVNVFNKINNSLTPINESFIEHIKNSYKLNVTVWHCFNNHKAFIKGTGTSIALPIDNNNHFQWKYSDYNNNLDILKNNDGTISLSVNGGPYYKSTGNGQGYYEINHRCNESDHAFVPHPFDENCTNCGTSCSFVHSEGDLILESIVDMY